MMGFGYVQDVFMNLGPYAAGASVVVAQAYLPLPGPIAATLAVVPPAMYSAAAGYAVATPGEDQACAALKGVAGGVGAAFVLSRL